MSVPTSNSMILYDRISDVNATVNLMGNAIAKSQMFGCSSLEQGQVFAMECIALRVPPLTLARKYHVIDGKLSQKADDMVSDFVKAGGKIRIVERTPEVAHVELSTSDDKQTFRFTWAEAQQEMFVYQGKQADLMKYLAEPTKFPRPPFRDKYATPRSRMQMLWARVVSDGIRAMGGANHGVYTPEELDADAADVVDDGTLETYYTTLEPKTTLAPAPAPQPVVEDAVIVQPVAEVTAAPKLITPWQVSRIQSLMEEIYTYDVRVATLAKKLAKCGIGSITSMLLDDAAEMIAKLEEKKAIEAANKAVAAESMAAQATTPTPAQTQPAQGQINGRDSDPCSPEQEKKIKEELGQIEQVKPGTLQKFVDALKASGRKKIAELTVRQAKECLAALEAKNLEHYIVNSLLNYKKEVEPTKEGETPF